MPKITRINVPFTQIGNDILIDKKLSLKSKGLISYLHSKPEGWDFSFRRIALETKDGEKAILSGLKELEEVGLLVRQKRSNGKVDYLIYPSYSQSQNPSTQNGYLPKRQLDKKGTISNKDIKVIKNLKKERIRKSENPSLLKTSNKKKSKTPNPLINQIIREFESIKGFSPTDRKPRWVAYNFVRRLEKFYIEIGRDPTPENLSSTINKFFTLWVAQEGSFTYTKTLGNLYRNLPIYFAKIKKQLKEA